MLTQQIEKLLSVFRDRCCKLDNGQSRLSIGLQNSARDAPRPFKAGMNGPTLFGAWAQGYPFPKRIFILHLQYDGYLFIDMYDMMYPYS